MKGSFFLRITIAFIVGVLFIVVPLATLRAQALIGVVDYMKVENPENYLEIEKKWKKIHEQRIKEGMIVGWSIFQVMFKTTEDPYNYVTISWYDSFGKLDKGVPENTLEESFPEYSKDDWKQFNENTENSRKLIASGVFHQRLTSSSEGLKLNGVYYVVNEISVKKGESKEYIELFRDVYIPMYKEDISNGNRVSWSLWEKWPGNMKDFQYLAADGYTNLDQIEPIDFLQYFKEIHPDKDIDEISEQVEAMRELVNTEMWKLIFRAN